MLWMNLLIATAVVRPFWSIANAVSCGCSVKAVESANQIQFKMANTSAYHGTVTLQKT